MGFHLFPLQAGRCHAEAHPRRDRPPALLPLAAGHLPGGRPHRAADRLRQEPGREGGGHQEEEALVIRRAVRGMEKLGRESHMGRPNTPRVPGVPSGGGAALA